MKNPFGTIFSDTISSSITLTPGILTFIIEYNIIAWLLDRIQFKILAFTPLLLIPFIFIAIIFGIRLCLPNVKEGRFPMTMNKGFIAWGLNLSLGRSIRVFQLQDLFYSSYVLKFLYWRAMGAKIAFGVNSSMYVNLVDLQLIEIGAGSMLGDEVQVGCHLIQGNHIYLKKVVIGVNSFVGINSKLGPGTKIGDNCMIGPWNFLLRHKIKDNTELEAFTYFQKNS
jgi:NDP-sugar pyrophosphorylase family protein